MPPKPKKEKLWVGVKQLEALAIYKYRIFKDRTHAALKKGDKFEAKFHMKTEQEFEKWFKDLRKLSRKVQMWKLDAKDLELFGDEVYYLSSASMLEDVYPTPDPQPPCPFSEILALASDEDVERWKNSP